MPISNAEALTTVNAVSGSATAPTAEPTALMVPAVHHRQKTLVPRALSTVIIALPVSFRMERTILDM
ncbi:hypothetical protein GCM10020216_109340 [Nonomuraea helvata]